MSYLNLLATLGCSVVVVGSTRFVSGAESGAPANQPGLVLKEFIADPAPTKSSHASTIVESRLGLMAAWFGGLHERSPDVGIWISRHDGTRWSEPVQVADGLMEGDDRRYPCWNPVLFLPKVGPLLLFYKVGPSPESWWGMLMTSDDHGRNWRGPTRLPKDIVGPVRNKPVELLDNVLLCGSSTEDAGWRVHMERTRDFGKTWSRTGVLNDPMEFGVIQPTILVHRGGRLQILCRSKQEYIIESWSEDEGKTWSRMKRTTLPNPNSAIDAVNLRDGRFLLVYNHATEGRQSLNVAVSEDGRTWQAALVLENQPGEYSYPAAIQASDGLVHATYTWKRERIRHVVLDPAKLQLRPMPDGEWPR
jgi:predicted neuraminidase